MFFLMIIILLLFYLYLYLEVKVCELDIIFEEILKIVRFRVMILVVVVLEFLFHGIIDNELDLLFLRN